MEKKTYQKMTAISIMTFVFWVASLFISGLVGDREWMSKQAQNEIAESWSNKQDFVGPIICVPVCKDSTATMPYTCMYVLPERLEMTADIQSETLHRGMFDASVYRTKVNGKGSYNLSQMHDLGQNADKEKSVKIDWKNAQIIVAIKDKRGLEDGIKVNIGGKVAELNMHFNDFGKSKIASIFGSDMEPICATADLSAMVGRNDVNFEVTTELKGSGELNVAPIGQSTVLTISGNCKDPSFNGFMLPSSRNVTDDGFEATWKISSLNRNDVDQVFYADNREKAFQTVGTKLLIMGGQYTKTDRALKYAFLVILLSLAAVFTAEMCVKGDINVLSYVLISCALVLFYLLLLSFGEWVGFSAAYFISAFMTLGLIGLYLKAIVRKNLPAIAVCMFMALVNLFIFVLLSIESMALLAGTLGLFVVVGAAMFFSLRIVNNKPEKVQE
ncbi:MAG: cell envelope integrity protein CreD [Bacteroidales bacterium]|nr:cell envelope integrity protein CreD [Candidatus Liminaster caballi]